MNSKMRGQLPHSNACRFHFKFHTILRMSILYISCMKVTFVGLQVNGYFQVYGYLKLCAKNTFFTI